MLYFVQFFFGYTLCFNFWYTSFQFLAYFVQFLVYKWFSIFVKLCSILVYFIQIFLLYRLGFNFCFISFLLLYLVQPLIYFVQFAFQLFVYIFMIYLATSRNKDYYYMLGHCHVFIQYHPQVIWRTTFTGVIYDYQIIQCPFEEIHYNLNPTNFSTPASQINPMHN